MIKTTIYCMWKPMNPYTCTCTCTCITTAKNWSRGPHLGVSQQEVVEPTAPLAAELPAPLYPSIAWPPKCKRGTYSRACKAREQERWGTASSDGIRISILDSDRKIPHPYTR